MADEPTTEPTSGATAPQAGQTPSTTEPAAGEEGKGGKAAVLADLAAERDKRQALEKTVADLQKQYTDQWGALSQAFGIKPEEASGTDPVETLTQQVQQIQKDLAESNRKAAILQVAAAPGATDDGQALPPIPAEYLHLLENAPTEALAETAKSVAQLLAKTASAGTGYATSAGQGQHRGDSTSLPAQIAAAEKELQGTDAGSVEHKQAQRRLMSLKSQQLFQATQPGNA